MEYEEAVKSVAKRFEQLKEEAGIDLFGCSTALSIVFNRPKEITMNDLVKERTRR